MLSPCTVGFKNHADDLGFRFNHIVVGFRTVSLFHISIAIRRSGQYVHDSLLSLVPFAAACPLGDLRAFVLGDHTLELHQQLVLRWSSAVSPVGDFRKTNDTPQRPNSSASITWYAYLRLNRSGE